jgi:hypothetical protein
MKRIFTVTVALLLLGAMSWAAAQGVPAKPAKKARITRIRVALGKVVSVSATGLVILHKVKGKEETSTFTLNGETIKEGDPAAGNLVTVHYTIKSGDNVATLVKVSAPRTEKASTARQATDSAPPKK